MNWKFWESSLQKKKDKVKIYLLKVNGITTDVVVLERDGTIIHEQLGELNQVLSFPSSQNPGTITKAKKRLQELITEYQLKGFVVTKERPAYIEPKALDKAKWHYGGDFPEELDIYQGYVPTGMFIGWLIEHDLIGEDFKKEFSLEINMAKNKKITPTKFYEDFMDGVFCNDIITPEAIDFVEQYFEEHYPGDYDKTLGQGLPSLYHVKDTLDNYNKIAEVITKRYSSQ